MKGDARGARLLEEAARVSTTRAIDEGDARTVADVLHGLALRLGRDQARELVQSELDEIRESEAA